MTSTGGDSSPHEGPRSFCPRLCTNCAPGVAPPLKQSSQDLDALIRLCELRFTKRPQKLVWLPSVSGHSLRLSTEHLKEFSRELRAYNTLKVEVPQDGAQPASYEFSLAGSAKAIRNLRRYCRFI